MLKASARIDGVDGVARLPDSSDTAPIVPNGSGSSSAAGSGSSDENWVLYAQRWRVLGWWSLMSLTSAMCWISYSPITATVGPVFGVSDFLVNAFSMCFMIMYLATFWIGGFTLNRPHGLRYATLSAATLTAVGSAIKLVDAKSFGWSFFGQSVIAFGQCFFLAAPPVLAASWFGDNERGKATGLALLFNSSGVAFGFLVPPLIVNSGDDLFRLFALQTAMASLATVGILLDFPAYPPSPPSYAAHQSLHHPKPRADSAEERSALRRQILTVFRNKQFMLLISIVANSSGLYWAISTVLGQLMSSFSDTEIGVTGTVATFLGIVSQLVFGWILDHTKWYRGLTVTGLVATGCSLMILNFGLANQSFGLIVFAISSISTFLSGVIPVCFELGVEQTYPMSEADSGTLLMLSANVMGLIFTAIFASSSPATMRVLMWIFGSGIALLAIVFALVFKPLLLRPKSALANGADSKATGAGTSPTSADQIEIDGLYRAHAAPSNHGSNDVTVPLRAE